MNATKNIIENLKAMGANPTTTTDNHGNDHIRINAPVLVITTLFDSDLEEYEYTRNGGTNADDPDENIIPLF